MARSSKQIKADLSRIKLETKTLKQQANTIASQYEKLGYKIPKKIQENRATSKDIQAYWKTINNRVNERVFKQEVTEDRKVDKLLKEVNQVQADRRNAISTLTQGYGSNFVNGLIQGKVAVLGRGITYSTTNATDLTINKVLNSAKRNKESPQEYLKKEIHSLKADLQNLQSVNKEGKIYIANQIKELIESQGFSISDNQMNKIKNKLNSTDWLGSQKIINTISSRIENAFYSIYKLSLEDNNNEELMDTIFSDISKSSHTKMALHSRILGE